MVENRRAFKYIARAISREVYAAIKSRGIMRFLPVAFRTILLFKMTDIAYNHTNARRFVLSLLFRCPFNAVNSAVGARVHVLAALLSFFLSLLSPISPRWFLAAEFFRRSRTVAGAHIYYIRLACSRDVSSIAKVSGEKYFQIFSMAMFLSICRVGCNDMIISRNTSPKGNHLFRFSEHSTVHREYILISFYYYNYDIIIVLLL